MFIAPEVSAQVAPSLVVALGFVGCVGWAVESGCNNPTGEPVDKFC